MVLINQVHNTMLVFQFIATYILVRSAALRTALLMRWAHQEVVKTPIICKLQTDSPQEKTVSWMFAKRIVLFDSEPLQPRPQKIVLL